MRGADLQPGKFVERTFEEQMRQRDRCLQRIADYIAQPAISLQSAGEFCRSLRMNEDQRPELIGFRPEGMEFRIGELFAIDAPADQSSTQAELSDRRFELLGGEVGILQGYGPESDKAFRLLGADLGQLFILQFYDLLRQVALGFVPIGIDAERL